MATFLSKAFVSLFLFLASYTSGLLGAGITCEQLDRSTCAFAVSSSGLRCVLEKHVQATGREEERACRTSGVTASVVKDWVETDVCVEVCGLSRETLGISSDALLDRRFISRLCSRECYQSCPNIVDLYFNVAASEGVFLPNLCQANGDRREMVEEMSSGEENNDAAFGPGTSPMAGRKLIDFDNNSASPPTAGNTLHSPDTDW